MYADVLVYILSVLSPLCVISIFDDNLYIIPKDIVIEMPAYDIIYTSRRKRLCYSTAIEYNI